MSDTIKVSTYAEWKGICERRGAKVKGNRAYKAEAVVGKFNPHGVVEGVYDARPGVLEPVSNKFMRLALKRAESALQNAYRALKEADGKANTMYPDSAGKTGMADTSGHVEDGVASFVNQFPENYPQDTHIVKSGNSYDPTFQGTDKGPYPTDKGNTVSNTPGQSRKESAKAKKRIQESLPVGLIREEGQGGLTKTGFDIYRTPEGQYTIFNPDTLQYIDSGGYQVDNADNALFADLSAAQQVLVLL